MTHKERILSTLAKSPRGLKLRDIRDRTHIAPNVLNTEVYNLKRSGMIKNFGGARGSYTYILTDKGRRELADPSSDQGLEKLVTVISQKGAASVGEIASIIDQIDEWIVLRRFIGWLEMEEGQTVDKSWLMARAMEFLGVDPEKAMAQRDSLRTVLEVMELS